MSNASLNRCTFIGNLGAAPELKYVGKEAKALSTFDIAVTEVWLDKAGQRQEKTEWVHINAWGKDAENAAKYLISGSPVYVEGRWSTEKYADPRFKNEKGEPCMRYRTKLNATVIKFLSDSRRAKAGAEQHSSEPELPDGDNGLPEVPEQMDIDNLGI